VSKWHEFAFGSISETRARRIGAGPGYHFDAANPSVLKLPESLNRSLFIYEWMRNWIQAVKLDTPGPEIEPFTQALNLLRPFDLKIGPDGALYMLENGDPWWEDNDSRIVRIVYRRAPALHATWRRPLPLVLPTKAAL
jgi:cytochrome c